MKTFRIEYFNNITNELKVTYIGAEDSNQVKNIWNLKYKNKGRIVSLCDNEVYDKMLIKYYDLMQPIIK